MNLWILLLILRTSDGMASTTMTFRSQAACNKVQRQLAVLHKDNLWAMCYEDPAPKAQKIKKEGK